MALITWTQSYFADHGVDSPRSDAEILLAHVLKCERIDLYLRHDQPLNPDELARYKALVRRRAQREPVAYILGQREFWKLRFQVSPQVLIPRPETEGLVQAAGETLNSDETPRPARVLELGTGSGAVIISLAAEHPGNLYFAMDRSAGALAIAKTNAQAHLSADTIRFYRGSWLDGLRSDQARFDLMISNPPYIATSRLADLQPEVSVHEPRAALDGGPDGLAALREIIHGVPDRLAPGGWLMIEIGHDQARAVADLAKARQAFEAVQWELDLAGHKRVAKLRKKSLSPGF